MERLWVSAAWLAAAIWWWGGWGPEVPAVPRRAGAVAGILGAVGCWWDLGGRIAAGWLLVATGWAAWVASSQIQSRGAAVRGLGPAVLAAALTAHAGPWVPEEAGQWSWFWPQVSCTGMAAAWFGAGSGPAVMVAIGASLLVDGLEKGAVGTGTMAVAAALASGLVAWAATWVRQWIGARSGNNGIGGTGGPPQRGEVGPV
ncbi:MAG: hypothetical protein K6U14_03955 [Firmicutes bacterium]|nr:hypothetical protein [Alicyclobacillaceae bacterium]MCL6496775.1 hypothetical protein [Bacillota bacterium]